MRAAKQAKNMIKVWCLEIKNKVNASRIYIMGKFKSL